MDQKKLDKILTRYTGMAAAVLGVQAANGQVVWTDVVDSTLSKNGDHYDFNINADFDSNNDPIFDFRITQLVDSTSSDFTGVVVESKGPFVNQVIGLDYANYNYPFKLNVWDTIGASQTFKGINTGRNIGYMAFEVNGVTYPNSQFVDTVNGITDGFLGLRFRTLENDTVRTHYGWIRLDVSKDLRVTIKGFAYEQTPDSMIVAGEGAPIGVRELVVDKPEMVQQGRFLKVDLPENFKTEGQLRFYSLGGQLIREEEIVQDYSTIELGSMPKGVLVAVLETNGAEHSKKVVVY